MQSFSENWLPIGLAGYVAGVVAGLLFSRNSRVANYLSFGLGAVAALVSLVACVQGLVGGEALVSQTRQLLPSLTPIIRFSIRLDPLGLFFGVIVSLLGVALSIYSLGYARSFYGHKSVGVFGALFNTLLLATTLVFLAGNAFFFLLAWEIMALSAYCLVSFEHEREDARRGGVLFFVMSHLGTACLALGFLLLFQNANSYEFDSFRALSGQLEPGRRNAAFALFLLGFGLKAGIVPLHIWLPVAHPVAPSNVSALMSGVIIKTGIYGLARVFFEFLGTPPQWWGVTVLTIGVVSAVLGVLYALMEHDLKRLLAYHSIENIGIILMGLGASMMFLQARHPLLATMALIAGLYHTMNHAVFKGLLFLGAGAVLQAAGTRNMEDLGGLIHRMPKTAMCFLLGAVAISALPPLNGFVSEWLTYQALLQGFSVTPGLIRVLFPLSGAMLALTGALAAACFVKAFGITFLAQPRSGHARQAREVSSPMLAGQGLLAAVCVLLGLAPSLFLRVLDPVGRQLAGVAARDHLVTGSGWVLSGVAAGGGTVSTAGMTILALCLCAVPLALWWLLARRARTRIGPSWDCGLKGLTPQMEYTATGFSKPIRMIFKALFRPRREVQREYDFSPYFATTVRFESHVEEIFETRIYRPLNWLVLAVSRRLRALQAGSIQAYLIYIFITLLALLFWTL
jgi:hydrogenase-4 component B